IRRMVTGDYYDSDGNWIGNDTFNDGLVPNAAEAAQIRQGKANAQPVRLPTTMSSSPEILTPRSDISCNCPAVSPMHSTKRQRHCAPSTRGPINRRMSIRSKLK